MTKSLPMMATRTWRPAATILSAAMLTFMTAPLLGVSIEEDSGAGVQIAGGSPGSIQSGIPIPLSARVPAATLFDTDITENQAAYSIQGVPTNLFPEIPYYVGSNFTETVLRFDTSAFVNPGESAFATDVDVSLRLRHPNISDLEIYVAIVDQDLDATIVPLMIANGCGTGDFPDSTVFNQDLAIYFDDDSSSSVDDACDRAIPSIMGRLIPTAKTIDPDLDPGLFNLNGADLLNDEWFLVIRDNGTTGNRASLIDAGLTVNGAVEGDTAPREETSTAPKSQSGNNIVTETDYVTNAFHLLGYNYLDQRLYSATDLNLRNIADKEVVDNIVRSSSTEFARLDSAPASSGGDGVISVADFVQSTRYAASLDELQKPSVGPLSRDDRVLFSRTLDGDVLTRGSDLLTTVSIMMRSKDAETEVGFGLTFDPELLEFVGVERGDCIPENAIFQVNREVEDDPGLVGLRVGVGPDDSFVCAEKETRPLLSYGDPNADTVSTWESVTENDDRTRPLTQDISLRTELVDIIYPKSGGATAVVDIILDQDNAPAPIRAYELEFVVPSANFGQKMILSRRLGGDFPVAPTVTPLYELNTNDELYRMTADAGDTSTFESGVLARLEFEIVPGYFFNDPLLGFIHVPVLAEPRLELIQPGGLSLTAAVNPELLAFSRITYDDTATTPINRQESIASLAYVGDSSFCDAGSPVSVDVLFGQNVLTLAQLSLTVEYDPTEFTFINAASGVGGLGLNSGGILVTEVDDDTSRIRIGYNDLFSQFQNGSLARLNFVSNGIDPNAEAPRIVLTSLDVTPSQPELNPCIQSNALEFVCGNPAPSAIFDPQGAGSLNNGCANRSTLASNDSPRSVGVVSNLDCTVANLSSNLTAVADDGGLVRSSIAFNAQNASCTVDEDITGYYFYMTFDETQVAVDLDSLADGGFGALPTITRYELPDNGLQELPNIPTSSYATYIVDGRNINSGFDSGTLFTLDFLVDTPVIAGPSIHISSKPPRNENVEIARAYFRARPGVGSQATTVNFGPNPFFDGLAARNPAGASVYMSFIDAGLTILDPADDRPTVRIVDTVLNADSEGNVLIALDSVGEETGVGFTLKFNPEDMEILSVDPGRDIPADAFFYTNPNALDPEAANETGELRMLISLQPGNAEDNNRSFEPGQRILANLRFRTRGLSVDEQMTGYSTNLEFLPLSDSREVVDANAIPIVTRFPVGTVNFAPETCIYTVNPVQNTFDVLGGVGGFDVTASTGCPWVATSTDEWILLDNEGAVNFSQSGRVTFTVSSNSGGPRTGTIEVGGVVYTVNQDGCAFALSPAQRTFPGDGGTGTFEIDTEETCNWQVQTDATWVIITSQRFNTGDGTVSYRVEQNVGTERDAIIRINNGGEGLEFMVSQRICEYAVDPAQSEVHPSNGGIFTFDIVADGFCSWEITQVPDFVSIVSPETSEGSGTVTVTYSVAQNFADEREGILRIADQQFIISQAGAVECTYELSESQAIFPATGGDGTIELITLGECPWNVAVDVDWIEMSGAETGVGSNLFTFTVDANTDVTRIGIITIAGEELRIQQFGSNEFTFDFQSTEEGWRSEVILGDVTPAYDSTVIDQGGGQAVERGRLNLTANENDGAFGTWYSPRLRLDNTVEAGDFFLATYEFTTNVAQTTVPSIRMRVSSADYERTNEFWVFSTGNGNFAPTGLSRNYRHLFSLPVGDTEFRTFFDLISFEPTKAEVATISLESITLVPAELSLEDVILEDFLLMANNGAGFNRVPEEGQIDEYLAPRFSSNDRGIAIGVQDSRNTPTETTFGFWTKRSDVEMEAERLYRMTFQVSARSVNNQLLLPERVPTFRVRVNSSTFRTASVVQVDSRDETSYVPTSSPVSYDVFMITTPQIVRDALLLNFDLIVPEGTTDDPGIELILESVRIRSYPQSTLPEL